MRTWARIAATQLGEAAARERDLARAEQYVHALARWKPPHSNGANQLFQLCSALYERSALIITSNLKFGDWNSVMGEEHLTAALLDRLTHRAHILEFLGESFRFRQRLQPA